MSHLLSQVSSKILPSGLEFGTHLVGNSQVNYVAYLRLLSATVQA